MKNVFVTAESVTKIKQSVLTDNVNINSHAELADLRTVERSENRLASRLSLLEQSSLGETLRAWSKSKTVSGSIRHCFLPVSLARFRNKFGMTLAEPVLQLNPSENSTKESTVHCHREGVSPWRARQKCSVLDWIATRSVTARNDAGGRAGLLFGWSLKSHVQPLWLALAAFTMAEILLSLTIIGVVAAITLPSLTGNINERTWNTQRKTLYARFSQALALMPSLNGYGILMEGDSSTSAQDTAAETFVTSGLSKVLKINNICDSEHLDDCGIPSKITPLDGSSAFSLPVTLVGLNEMFDGSWEYSGDIFSYSQIDTKAAAFETANGESVAVYYNPNCQPDMQENVLHFSQPKMCANFVYDLNGTKGPNTVGKDIGFITAIYPIDPIVIAPMPLAQDAANVINAINASSECKKQDSESRVPTRYELASIFYNRKLVGMPHKYYWSSAILVSNDGSNYVWGMQISDGHHSLAPKTDTNNLRCVKR